MSESHVKAARHFAMQIRARVFVIEFLDGCVKGELTTERIDQKDADMILEEWDALATPEQLPKPVLDAAIKRIGI